MLRSKVGLSLELLPGCAAWVHGVCLCTSAGPLLARQQPSGPSLSREEGGRLALLSTFATLLTPCPRVKGPCRPSLPTVPVAENAAPVPVTPSPVPVCLLFLQGRSQTVSHVIYSKQRPDFYFFLSNLYAFYFFFLSPYISFDS